MYRQHPQEVALTSEALAFTATERDRLSRLAPGVALWRVANRSFEVRHLLSDIEWALIETDAAMVARAPTSQDQHPNEQPIWLEPDPPKDAGIA